MRRLKKNYYLGLFGIIVAILGLVRLFTGAGNSENKTEITAEAPQKQSFTTTQEQTKQEDTGKAAAEKATDSGNGTSSKVETRSAKNNQNKGHRPHPIYSVPSFSRTFPDLQDVHAASASKWGARPVKNRKAAEKRKDELVYIGSCPYYKIDPGMNMSIPYLVPRAAEALETIARNYLDSLHIKGIPMHKILVSSVLRTEEDIERLRRVNMNASTESCHRYGTTFDIAYNRYHTVMPPNEKRRTVQNDTLKWILAEVLRDVRQQGLCHIKYEVKQGCFHITAR